MSAVYEPLALSTEFPFGDRAYALMQRLLGLCRSLTGDGVRNTFAILGERLPLTVSEIPSGTRVLDWTIPDEWNIRQAYVIGPDGKRVIDFRDSSLHVVGYSEPVRARLSLQELLPHLYTLPEQPELIPYRTSYYERTWGFCMTERQRTMLVPGDYEVVIDATLAPGHLSYAELELPGAGPEQILISTYVCHPSLANDNLSGIAVAAVLAEALMSRPRRYGYRFLFAPGTIGPLAWLHGNRARLDTVRHGLTVSCVGDDGPFTYKRSRREESEVNLAAEVALRDFGLPHRLVDFEPWGGDERQFCSPGFDLPLGALSRTAHAGYAGNHTSADNLDRIRPEALDESVRLCLSLLEMLDSNCTGRNLSPWGEPQLGKRGLYRAAGGAVATPQDERALLWVLNQSDGTRSLLKIARRSGLPYATVRRAAERLQDAGLLADG